MNRFAGEIDQWRDAASAAGVSAVTIAAAFEDLVPDDRVLARVTTQAEHELSVADYLARLVSDERVAAGIGMCRAHDHLLRRIEDHFGVPRQVLVAIWGIESNFGEAAGSFSVVRALATLASSDERRRDFWRDQLLAALAILDAGDVAVDDLRGSWAGAMGHTQFMPTTYLAHAVDFDGDGKRDIWASIADALASAANYLKASCWNRRLPWGGEAALGADFDFASYCDDEPRTLAAWVQAGLVVPDALQQAGVDGDRFVLLLPAGADGPVFLTSINFDALLAYNASKAYALAVAHLADRIDGRGPITAQWPAETPLSRSERVTLQRLLVAEGFDTGGVDGILGRMSRRAIRAYQLRCGLIGDGYHGRALLDRLAGAAGGTTDAAMAQVSRNSALEGNRKESN